MKLHAYHVTHFFLSLKENSLKMLHTIHAFSISLHENKLLAHILDFYQQALDPLKILRDPKRAG